jgi:uncharacterized phage-associated protein
MPYPAKAVANYFLDLAKGQGKQIDPMKMQKLVYFAHGWCLALKDAPLITERIEAWQYGPVVRELYAAFADVGSGPITHPAYETRCEKLIVGYYAPRIDAQEEEGQVDKESAKSLISEVWKVYGDFTAIQLSNLTHLPESPWAKAWLPNQRNTTIDDENIKIYFKAQALAA